MYVTPASTSTPMPEPWSNERQYMTPVTWPVATSTRLIARSPRASRTPVAGGAVSPGRVTPLPTTWVT
jgi:hypothetical protein